MDMTAPEIDKTRVAFRRFLRRDDGSATVEVVLWIPFFLLLIALIADASLLFNRQAQMLRDVQDANRAYSVGRVTSPAAVQTLLVNAYTPMSASVTATSTLDTSVVSTGIIRTTLSVPARDVNSIGLIASLSNFNLSVTAQHYREF
ncbi:MAG: pilus assembly protein [Rhodobacteraceae bacterium]|jgi:Flp pilus assembly protein TadG|nr:pilus assembly protein [Paracoccaceae bacterium]